MFIQRHCLTNLRRIDLGDCLLVLIASRENNVASPTQVTLLSVDEFTQSVVPNSLHRLIWRGIICKELMRL